MTFPTIEDAKREADAFRTSLPAKVNAASLTLESKTPFKALVLREALVHRLSSLTDGAVSEFGAGRWVSAVVLTRAVTETAALLFSLRQRVAKAVQQKSDDELTEFLRRTMVASRTEPDLPQALNVLGCVDAADRAFPGFRRQYDTLSEYAHPNWCGAMGAFSQLDRERHIVTFGVFLPVPMETYIAALMGALAVAKHVYNDLAAEIRALNHAFDSGDITYPTQES